VIAVLKTLGVSSILLSLGQNITCTCRKNKMPPLNLYYRKLNSVLTNRLIKFFQDQAKKDPVKYAEFYEDYGLFFREGIVTSPEQDTRVSAFFNAVKETFKLL
jgi:hypothetical protein